MERGASSAPMRSKFWWGRAKKERRQFQHGDEMTKAAAGRSRPQARFGTACWGLARAPHTKGRFPPKHGAPGKPSSAPWYIWQARGQCVPTMACRLRARRRQRPTGAYGEGAAAGQGGRSGPQPACTRRRGRMRWRAASRIGGAQLVPAQPRGWGRTGGRMGAVSDLFFESFPRVLEQRSCRKAGSLLHARLMDSEGLCGTQRTVRPGRPVLKGWSRGISLCEQAKPCTADVASGGFFRIPGGGAAARGGLGAAARP